jgi:outer membrane cobalamin receptor
MKALPIRICLFSFSLLCLGFPVATAQRADSTQSFFVNGACGMCKDRIEQAAAGKGVKSASWSEVSKMLTVTYNPRQTKVGTIEDRVVASGHDTKNKMADSAVYHSLPECCLYRDESVVAGHGMGEEPGNGKPQISGIVLQEDKKGQFKPLAGASVVWEKLNTGTTTNADGIFYLPDNELANKLVISFAGFRPDTVEKQPRIMLVLRAKDGALEEVTVAARQRSLFISTTQALRTQVMTEKELFKAACCNLSESFETNPSVDVVYSDAITGSKQIQMLGLSGNYTQLTLENLPGPRGLAMPMGLNYLPGTWIESIQLNKGPGSVVNGFESIAGQINVEMKKPENTDRVFANLYVNSMGKTDLNLNLSKKLNDKWSTVWLIHDAFLYNKMDFNKDGYRDLPTGNLFTALNRWNYQGTNGLISQIGIKYLTDTKTGGENAFDPSMKGSTAAYGLGWNTKRLEGFAKLGYVFPAKKYQSIGLQLSALDHDQQSYFGLRGYDASQKNFYSNLIYQSIINNSNHKFRTGLSLVHYAYNELWDQQAYQRNETVTGGFFEYSYNAQKKLSVVAGFRIDHNNLYGWFATPRLHARYQLLPKTTLRLSAGRGQRTANIFAENTSAFVSSRKVAPVAPNNNKAYGLNPEIAWNGGITLDQKWRMFNREATWSVEYFHNNFQNQVVADMEDPRRVSLYNLIGRSFSNSIQTELHMEPVKRLELRLAYRFYDVRTTYSGRLLERPLLARHRAFSNLAYETNGWRMDFTVNYIGSKRLPGTAANPPDLQFPERSPAYFLMNAQVSKSLGKKLEFYIGGENLSNFLQQVAIIDPENPFGTFFDASLLWGPVGGRMFYGGFRFRI